MKRPAKTPLGLRKKHGAHLGPNIEIVFGPDRTVISQYKTSVDKLTLEIARGWFAKSKAVRIERLASGLWD